MEQIIRAYGKFLLDGIIAFLMFGLIFSRIGDDAGNQRVLAVAGALLQREDTAEFTDFDVYGEECLREKPAIYYAPTELLYTGSYTVAELVYAEDDTGTRLPVRKVCIIDPYGREFSHMDTDEIELKYPGIYQFTVSAIDAWNRKSVCTLKIPVNGKEWDG